MAILRRMREAVASLLSNTGEISTKTTQHVRDTKLALLACTQHQMRREARKSGAVWPSHVADMPEEALYLEKAISSLEDRGLDNYSLRDLRSELQKILEHETVRIFNAFRRAEWKLDPSVSAGGVLSSALRQRSMEDRVKSILMREYVEAAKWAEKDDLQLKQRKCEEMLSIFEWKGWANRIVEDSSYNVDGRSQKELSAARKRRDEEGERRQLINLAKSSILKKELGYSLLTLRSTIGNAGMGLFVDGHAVAGSIVGFFPGDVWPKEYLLDTSYISHFADDSNLQLSVRHDDILIDSRQAPMFATADNGCNPWATAHVTNHPPPGGSYNCLPVMLNFTGDMGLEEDLLSYIPNVYAKEPKLIGTKGVDLGTFMHGLVLLAKRDVTNEELFYNYRLNPKVSHIHPEWYHDCDQEASKNIWGT